MSNFPRFEVLYEDGTTVTAQVRPKDVVSYERQYSASFVAFGSDASYERLCYLAWAPLHRTRVERADFDGFLDLIEDVTPIDDAGHPITEETPAAADDPSEATPTPVESAL